MKTKDRLYYKNFLKQMASDERDIVYYLIGNSLENNRLHPILTNEWQPTSEHPLFLYTCFSNEQKDVILKLVKESMKGKD